jgi:hypothetical protein
MALVSGDYKANNSRKIDLRVLVPSDSMLSAESQAAFISAIIVGAVLLKGGKRPSKSAILMAEFGSLKNGRKM